MKTESFEDPEYGERVIIAMKGLPCTGKTRVAYQIGDWAKRPVLSIDEFIEAPSDAAADDHGDSFQASALEQAFARLCRVARMQLNRGFRCVVIKSSLSSIFELQQLFKLVDQCMGDTVLLIVECQVRNKHQWQRNFSDDVVYKYERNGYRPKRWNDIEKARDDHYNHPQALAQWNHHLLHLINNVNQSSYYGKILVSRLVVDPSYDLDLKGYTNNVEINPIFAHAINHLVSCRSLRTLNDRNPYIVEFDEFRQSRAKEVLNALTPSTRSKDVCGERGCLFKYKQELNIQVDDDDCYCDCNCGVCEEKLVSGEPAYTCHYCFFTLHIPCAHLHITSHSIFPNILEYRFLWLYMAELPASEVHACKGCIKKGGFDNNCYSCCFQTVLKGRKLPLVVNHEHHPHPLSLRIQFKSFACKACGVDDYKSSYVCGICEWYYHLPCVSMPKELKHEHGGHEHVLELKHSHDGTEQEDYWCDVCFDDLDPYFQYYSCKSCPYYAAHLCCAGVHPRHAWPAWTT